MSVSDVDALDSLFKSKTILQNYTITITIYSDDFCCFLLLRRNIYNSSQTELHFYKNHALGTTQTITSYA